MNRELIINVTPTEITIALVEDKVLVELNKEQCKTGFAVGDIYLGKIRKIMPGLNAAFVNIGHEKDAFIHYLDLGTQFASLSKLMAGQTGGRRPMRLEGLQLEPAIEKGGKISSYLQVGQSVMVQVAKEAISTKGPRLTADISLAGRNVVLVPFSNKVFISQKIRSNEEKKRLKRIAQGVLPRNFGVIIRTAAQGASDADVELDIRTLVDKWHTALGNVRRQTPPSLLLSELNRANTIIRDLLNSSFSSITVDDQAMYEQIREYIKVIAPDKEKIVRLYKGSVPIFDNFDISKQIKSLFAKYVSLKRGAYLIIEHTEAMHVIDVNSGNRTKKEDDQEVTAMEVNMAAAAEIARQLRLRDMGGIIVVDFIDMHEAANRKELYNKLKEEMSKDRARHTILPASKFGLIQITRQRVRPETEVTVQEQCPTCHGSGKIRSSSLFIDEIENNLKYLLLDQNENNITLQVHPFIYAYITKGFISIRRRWKWRYKRNIDIKEVKSFHVMQYNFLNKNGDEILL